MHEKKIVDLAGRSLLRLRQIRTKVLETNPESFDGPERHAAEEIIDGITALCLAHFAKNYSGDRDVDVAGLVRRQEEALQKTESEYADLTSSSSLHDNNGMSIVDRLFTSYQSDEAMEFLLRANQLDRGIKPRLSGLVVSPLSTGPIVVRYMQRQGYLKSRVALAVVDTMSYHEATNLPASARRVYLPKFTSWPAEAPIDLDKIDRVIGLDDQRNFGVTWRAKGEDCG